MQDTPTLPDTAETRPEEAEDRVLKDLLGYNLKRVLSLVQTDLSRVLGAFQLRAVSFSALSVVVQSPGINQTQLAEVLKIERSNLVQIIDELAGRKLIARTPVPGDRRRHALMPTVDGQALLAAAQTAVIDHEQRVFQMLTAKERTEMLRLLRKVRAGTEG